MKAKIFFITLFLSQLALCQTIVKSSIDNGGASVRNTNIELVYTIGEVNVQEVTAGNISISEGFIGSDLIASNPYIIVPDVEILLVITVECEATPTAPTATNGYGDAFTAIPDVTFPITMQGTTEILWTYDDGNGNTVTQTQNVIIEDVTPPVITCIEDDSRYIDPYQTYYTVLGDEFDATATDNCDVAAMTYTGGSPVTSGSSMDVVQLSLGNNSMEWTAEDVNGNKSDCTTIVEVLKRPTLITYNGDLDEQYSDQVDLSATLTDYVSGNGVVGKTITFTIGSQSTTAITDLNGVASTVLILTQDPNLVYNVKAEFTEDASYLDSSDIVGFDITQENAIVEYTGLMLQATDPNKPEEAEVMLSFNIQDITCTDPADPDAGDIRNAIVEVYVDGDLKITSSTIILVNPGDSKTGTVSFPYTFDIGSSASITYEVEVLIGGYYAGSSPTEMITVYKPEGDFITGGGYIVPENSGGMYASTDGLKTNFGFNVKYNKKGNKLKGHMNVIFRKLESDGVHVYQIKSNAVQSLGVDISDENAQFATFITKSNLTDVTDPLYPISLGGNLILKVDMTDRGEPGTFDSIAFNLTEKGTLLYSSNWTGIITDEMQLSGGNLVVHSGFSATSKGDILYELDNHNSKEFDVKSWPNPSSANFNLRITTNNTTDRVEIKIFDIRNRLIKVDRFKWNDQYKFGDNLQSGIYFVRITQGILNKTIRVMKQ